MKTKRKIIGATVRLKCDIATRGCRVFDAGTVFTIEHSYRGYTLRNDTGIVSRVAPSDVEFIDDISPA